MRRAESTHVCGVRNMHVAFVAAVDANGTGRGAHVRMRCCFRCQRGLL